MWGRELCYVKHFDSDKAVGRKRALKKECLFYLKFEVKSAARLVKLHFRQNEAQVDNGTRPAGKLLPFIEQQNNCYWTTKLDLRKCWLMLKFKTHVIWKIRLDWNSFLRTNYFKTLNSLCFLKPPKPLVEWTLIFKALCKPMTLHRWGGLLKICQCWSFHVNDFYSSVGRWIWIGTRFSNPR